jgi:hypothetical protein
MCKRPTLQERHVPLSVVTIIESDCSEQDDMTEQTPILKSVHNFNDSFQRRRVLLSLVTSTESD